MLRLEVNIARVVTKQVWTLVRSRITSFETLFLGSLR